MLLKRLTIPFVAVALLVGACGAPEFEYVKNSEQQTYFKVPNEWAQVDQDALDAWAVEEEPDSAAAELRSQLMWTVAYDAAEDPDLAHIASTASTPQPVVWAKVERLVPTAAAAISLNELRDMWLPVTEDRRQFFEENGVELPYFELLHDEVLTPEKGLHGVRVVYNWRMPGRLHTFDMTALVNDDASVRYMLLVRCTASCYQERFDELQNIVTSFTVRS
ncbi:hypothetical protein [Phytohabitans suffuscus]|uniref:Lipoprotein n=1 Tax=Phytohabitans suffuscus TaxID=624315 RepID=A0A6F8YBC9_9ACTN|nr:hypothetical protein [Phytohabitans suffuscus]BCB83396.1 hypothetical protein Psuf_007090 [Phytohabitans suffuscus]